VAYRRTEAHRRRCIFAPGRVSRYREDRELHFALIRQGPIYLSGTTRRAKRVRDRIIAYDLRHLNAVLTWATLAGDGRGGFLLERQPLKGLPIPKEESPRRAVVTTEQYAKLRQAAHARGPDVEALVVVTSKRDIVSEWCGNSDGLT
jgi:hypothetical protein